MASELAMQYAAQAWCRPETSSKDMDPELALAFAEVLDNWLEVAGQQTRDASFYCDLIDQCAKSLGPEAYTADDGTVMQDPVRLKVPELVERLRSVLDTALETARQEAINDVFQREWKAHFG